MEIGQRQAKFDLGRMNQQVYFRMPLKGRNDTTNEEIRTYIISSAVWAGIEYSTKSKETEVAARKTELVHVVFTMYFRDAVRTTWRIVYRDAEFEIESILPDAHRQFMRVEAVLREPWQDDYWTSEDYGHWTDGSGNYWIVEQRGINMATVPVLTEGTQPTYGGLTWTSSSGATWTVT